LNPDRVLGVDHQSAPVEAGGDQGHLHYCNAGKPLQLVVNPAEDEWMSDRLQSSQLTRVIENDPSQSLAVDLAFENDRRPSLGNRAKALLGEDLMADRVRIDGVNASFRQ
jgi:hypothetical protein